MRRVGLIAAVGLLACGPLVAVPEDGSTSDEGPDPDDDEDDDTTSTTTTSTTSTVTTTPSPTTTASPTATSPSTITTTGPIEDCVDLELVDGPVGPGLTAGSTVGRGDEFQFCQAGGETSGGGGTGEDYVVSWTAAATGVYHFSLVGSDYDTVLGLFPPECGGVPHDCNDDCGDTSSALDYSAIEGETIYIVIDGFYGQTGNFVLTIGNGVGECGFESTSGHDSGAFISTAGPE